MFLLIHTADASRSSSRLSFTFQYVSINTSLGWLGDINDYPLHSNMFLLIHEKTCTLGWAQNYFTFQYVSINTFAPVTGFSRMICFTFQYVSINTGSSVCESMFSRRNFTFQYVSINTFLITTFFAAFLPLHSNMFLLILQLPDGLTAPIPLYIPICFY